MVSKTLLLVATCLTTILAVAPPNWPEQYYVKGTFSLPYFEIVEPIELWYDGVNNRELFTYYDAMDTYLWRFDTQTLYQVVPRIDTMTCFVTPGIGNGPMVTLLPNLTTWTYKGITNKHHTSVLEFQQVITNFNKTAVYTMYVNSKTGAPVELHLDGYDFVFGSHPDIYVMKFEVYTPGPVNASIFDAPMICDNDTVERANIHRARAVLGQVGVLTPPSELSHPFDLFRSQHKKIYGSREEYEYRRSIWEENMKYIDTHNANPDATFTLAMNHLGDFTREEVRSLLYPKPEGVDRSTVSAGATRTHVPSTSVPDYVNWVEQGGVTMVKDQGVCGSCWTFGTAGSIEGAYFVKTGDLISLSEQQILDCAWGTWVTGNSGCDGGFAPNAYEWIMQNGGIALEDSYKYLMMDHWCNAFDKSSGIKVTGYVNITSGDEDALVDAIATAGPCAIAIDASHPSFTFYTGGVYYEPQCQNGINDLDHEVLAVGYGTDEDTGLDYFLVKNSWSTHWGVDGYVKMIRNKNNNCGVATAANYPIVA